MRHEASRQILWNIDNWYDVYLMYGLLLVASALCFIGLYRRTELWLSGQPAPEHTGRYFQRFRDMFRGGLMQSGVVRDKLPALAHTMIYLGFIVLLFATTMVFIHQDLRIKIYQGEFYLAVTLLADLFGFAALLGCALLAYRRYVLLPDQLHSKGTDATLLIYIALLIVQGFALEGLRIHATNDPWASYSPIGWLFAKSVWFLSERSTREIHYFTWWFHTLTVYSALIIFPYSKFFHILASSLNLYFKKSGRQKGSLAPVGDIEALMNSGEEVSFGLGTIKDYSWKQLMDLDACTSCGRCQDACPAYKTGKPLSPKWVILDTRNHALALQSQGKLSASKLPSSAIGFDNIMLDSFLKDSGLTAEANGGYAAQGAYRALNALTQTSALSIGNNSEQMIAGEVIDPEVFWSCTTCYACVEACPVGINHVDQIIGNRRNLALMRGEIPEEAQRTLRSLENRGNPYGAPEDRIKWTEGISVPLLKAGDSVDILFWVGCVSSFDPRKQKIAKALVQIFNKAGINYGILGNLESCTGDPAKRLGEENLFQVLAKQNIATFKSVNFKRLVTNCPHCFNSFKNDYPEFGGISTEPVQILHHSQFLMELLDKNQLNLKDKEQVQNITFHDPCYLGRYNDEYEAPRESLKKIKGLKILEMEKSRNKGMCCGAGGGHFWMDKKVGERVNFVRAEQAHATGAETIATACPFCLQMMEDGTVGISPNSPKAVRDIAEIIADSLELK